MEENGDESGQTGESGSLSGAGDDPLGLPPVFKAAVRPYGRLDWILA